MQSNKIVFVTLPRSGSTYMCKLAKQCFKTKQLTYLQVNPEVSNIDQWKNNNQNIIEENLEVINSLNLDVNHITGQFVNRMFLHYLTQPNPIVLKYFPFDSYDFGIDELVAVSKRHNIRLICLYRKNILNTFVSHIVKSNFIDIDSAHHKLALKSDVQFNSKILDYDIIESHQIYLSLFKTLSNAGVIERVIAYEDLSFDHQIDSALLYDNVQLTRKRSLTKKIVTPDLTHHVLNQMPFDKETLMHRLQQSGIPVTNDFGFSLDV